MQVWVNNSNGNIAVIYERCFFSIDAWNMEQRGYSKSFKITTGWMNIHEQKGAIQVQDYNAFKEFLTKTPLTEYHHRIQMDKKFALMQSEFARLQKETA